MTNYKKVILLPLIMASLLLVICMAWVTYSMAQLIDLSAKKDLVDFKRYNIVSLRNAVSSSEVGLKGYLMTHNVKMLNRYKESDVAINIYLKNIQEAGLTTLDADLLIKHAKGDIKVHQKLLANNVQVEFHGGSYASHLSLVKDQSETLTVAIKNALSQADALLYEQRVQYGIETKKQVELTVISGVLSALMVLMVLIFSYRRTSSLFREITEKEVIVNDLNHQVMHDPLTNLVNRRGFEKTLEREHEEAILMRKQYSVLFMDLDGFKAVNDNYGHDIGDQLLEQVAKRFTLTVRSHDLLARLGGDEFALILNQYKTESELKQLAGRLIDCLATPITIDHFNITVGVSVGIAVFPKHASTVSQILNKADEAMYQSKKSGKNIYSMATH